jgi:hypothetical protein
LEGSCSYSPSREELNEHAKDYEDLESVRRLKLWLKQALNTNSDGWVPNDGWEAERDTHRAAYDEWIQTAREAEARGKGLTVAKRG